LRGNPGIKAYLALVAVCFFWGTTYLAIRMGLESFPPLMLVSTRYFISGTILVAAALIRGAALPRGKELMQAVISGLLILGVGNGCLTLAETHIPSGLAGLFVTLSPFWLVGIEAMLPGGEPLHAPTILGMIVAFAGVALLLSPGFGSEGFSRSTLIGFSLLQVGMAAWSFGSIYQRRREVRAHPVVIGAVQQLITGLAVSPLAWLFGGHQVHWKTRGVGALVYLVIFGSIVGYSCYAYVLDKLPVAVVSIYAYINAVVAVGLGWLVYREPFGLRETLAMLVIFAGVGLVKWQSGKAALAKMEVEA